MRRLLLAFAVLCLLGLTLAQALLTFNAASITRHALPLCTAVLLFALHKLSPLTAENALAASLFLTLALLMLIPMTLPAVFKLLWSTLRGEIDASLSLSPNVTWSPMSQIAPKFFFDDASDMKPITSVST